MVEAFKSGVFIYNEPQNFNVVGIFSDRSHSYTGRRIQVWDGNNILYHKDVHPKFAHWAFPVRKPFYDKRLKRVENKAERIASAHKK